MSIGDPFPSERAQRLLKMLVERYIADGQPVGSRALAKLSGLELSPASIRNVMADLEEIGFISSPHTSAGRVPTPRGYRFFVDTLLQVRPLDQVEINQLEGQLTATLMASENDIRIHDKLVESVKNICGRIILNSVPTGVEVCLSMHHGGPYPATTDSRFGSVGADAIKRFVRPIAFQNWNNEFLPDELKNENPLGIWRTVNGELQK